MYKFFRQIALFIGLYYSDILLQNGWETVTGANKLTISDLVIHGNRCKKINTKLNQMK